jgi:hypothetical protein
MSAGAQVLKLISQVTQRSDLSKKGSAAIAPLVRYAAHCRDLLCDYPDKPPE